MSATDTVFAGSIPAIYDRYMVSLLFAPYAALVAERARALAPRRIRTGRVRRAHVRARRDRNPIGSASGLDRSA